MPLNRRSASVRLTAALEPHGFRRQGTSWRRHRGPYIDVINLQVGTGGRDFTINLGVLDPEVYAWVWSRPASADPDEAACAVRARLGPQVSPGGTWWKDTTPATLTEVIGLLETQGIPYLNSFATDQSIADHLAESAYVRGSYPPAVLSLAFLYVRSGDQAKACHLLQKLARDVKGLWAESVKEAGAKLGCFT